LKQKKMKTSARIERVAIYETTPFVEEKLASLFQPDTLLPAEYLETTCRKAHLEPEKKLMFAVLKDAIDCFQDNVLAHGRRKKRLFREAEEWILTEDEDWLFSFENICEVLGFNPRYVRQGLIRWKEAELARRPKAKIYRLISTKTPPGKEKDHADKTIFAQDNSRSFDSGPNYAVEHGMRHCPAETGEVALRAAR